MPGVIAIAVAGALLQQAAPHPSTQSPYQAPTIRPYEPGPGPDVAPAQGDAEAAVHRRPLAAPVPVDAYARSYEFTPTEAEIAYEQGVASAERRADQTAGPLDGPWRVVGAGGEVLFDLVLADTGAGPVEGGWRGRSGSGSAVFDGQALTLEGAGRLALQRRGDGWRGTLDAGGGARPVTLIRPD